MKTKSKPNNQIKTAARGRVQPLVRARVLYMHTIDGAAGSYYPGQQICFAVRTRPIKLCDSLDQIKQEQRKTREWRTAQGFPNQARYGHLRVFVP
jgi:hypothetical protein